MITGRYIVFLVDQYKKHTMTVEWVFRTPKKRKKQVQADKLTPGPPAVRHDYQGFFYSKDLSGVDGITGERRPQGQVLTAALQILAHNINPVMETREQLFEKVVERKIRELQQEYTKLFAVVEQTVPTEIVQRAVLEQVLEHLVQRLRKEMKTIRASLEGEQFTEAEEESDSWESE